MSGLTPGQIGTTIALAAGAAVLLTMILTPAILRGPHDKADRLKPIAPSRANPPIMQTCSPPDCPPPDKNQVRLIPIERPAAIQLAEPKPAPVATAAPAQAIQAAPEAAPIAAEEPEPARRYQRNPGSDICARTGGRKIETRGGKSWRCLYARH